MKTIYKIFSIAVFALAAVSCSNDDDFTPIPTQQAPDFSGTYAQNDQMGRPAVNTVFVSSSSSGSSVPLMFLDSASAAVLSSPFIYLNVTL